MELAVCGCEDFRYGEANGQLKKERELISSQRKKEIKETHVIFHMSKKEKHQPIQQETWYVLKFRDSNKGK